MHTMTTGTQSHVSKKESPVLTLMKVAGIGTMTSAVLPCAFPFQTHFKVTSVSLVVGESLK